MAIISPFSKPMYIMLKPAGSLCNLRCKYCFADDSIESVARMMGEYDISSLPVVNEDMKVLGIITTDQISHLLS